MPRPLLKLVVANRPEQTFPQVWQPYPRKEAKKDALKAWVDLDPNQALVAEILAALEWQGYLWVEVERRQQNTIPLFGTYIRGERWTDERPASLRHWKRKELTRQNGAVDEQIQTAKRFDELMASGLTRDEARAVIHKEKGWAE